MTVKKILSRIKWLVLVIVLSIISIVGVVGFIRENNKSLVFSPSLDNYSWIIVKIGDREAAYRKINVEYNEIKASMGKLYKEYHGNKWFYKLGSDNLNYLILQTENNALYMWKFMRFELPDDETYFYGEALETIFHVECAEDIESIATSPITLESDKIDTDLEKEIQCSIGTGIYTNKKDIETFYNILVNAECYGKTGADPSTYPDDTRFTYSFSTEQTNKEESGEYSYGTRQILITLKSGEVIDCWIYDALSGVFCEGIDILFTLPLKSEDVNALNNIFGIQ